MEFKLPYINPVSLSRGLVNEYRFKVTEAWNAQNLSLPDSLGNGSVQLFIRNDFHYFRGKWKFHEPTRFFSADPVGKGMIDFRVNKYGGDIYSSSIQGEKNFEWDITEVDGFRFFVPEKYFNLNKRELAARFERYRLNPAIFEVEKELFRIDTSEISNVIGLESKMLELLSLWVNVLSYADIGGYLETVPDYRRRCLENARHILQEKVGEPPSIKTLSRQVGLNENYLKRDFHKLYGMPVRQYTIKLRMEKARQMIRESDLPVQEICAGLGYTNRGHFAELYKRYFGITPLADRLNPFSYQSIPVSIAAPFEIP